MEKVPVLVYGILTSPNDHFIRSVNDTCIFSVITFNCSILISNNTSHQRIWCTWHCHLNFIAFFLISIIAYTGIIGWKQQNWVNSWTKGIHKPVRKAITARKNWSFKKGEDGWTIEIKCSPWYNYSRGKKDVYRKFGEKNKNVV